MEVGNINLLGLLKICQPGLGQSPGGRAEPSTVRAGAKLEEIGSNIAHGGRAKGNMFY